MPIDACRAAIARFADACARDPLVLAAFLGGSFAAGRATEDSDVDVYVVSRERDYEELWARRRAFVATMGAPELVADFPDFEGLGDSTGLLDGVTFPLL